jgi:hypothetical protein
MSDRSGQARALTTFAPIIPGKESALHEHLGGFAGGAGSPLARSTRTHVARWVVIDRLPTQCVPRPDHLRCHHLLFSACFDGEETSYLTELTMLLGDEVPAIWGHCEGFPGVTAPSSFVAWLLEHRVPTSFFFSAYPHGKVHEVRNALAARDRALGFALRTQDLDPGARLRAFREAFP